MSLATLIRLPPVMPPLSGLNDATPRDVLNRNFTPDCKDVIYDNGWIVQRKGLSKVNTSAAPGTTNILGQMRYARVGPDARIRHLVHTNGNIYERTGTSVSSTVLAGMSIDEPARWASGLNRMVVCNGDSRTLVYDGERFTQPDEAPQGLFPIFYQDYMFIGHIKNQGTGPSVIQNSNLRDFTNWDADDAWNIQTNDGEALTGLAVDGPYLACFKRSSRTLIRGTFFDQSSAAFEAQKVALLRGQGSMSHDGMVSANGLLYFPDENGIFATRGGEIQLNLTQNIPNFWRRVNKNNGHLIRSAHWKQKQWILWSLPMDGAGICNYILVYDYRNGGLWPWEINSVSMLAFLEDDGVEHVYIGNDVGQLYDLYATDSDDGTAIDSYIDWPDSYGRGGQAHFTGVRLVLKATGTNSITVRTTVDGHHGSRQSSTVQVMNTQGSQDEEIERVVSCAHIGRTMRTRLSNSTDAVGWACREVMPVGAPAGLVR